MLRSVVRSVSLRLGRRQNVSSVRSSIISGIEADLHKNGNTSFNIFCRSMTTKKTEEKFIGIRPSKILTTVSKLIEKTRSSENPDNQYQLVYEIYRLLQDKETLFNAYEEPQADIIAKWKSIRSLVRLLASTCASLEDKAPQINAINEQLTKEDPNHMSKIEKNLTLARARAATKPGDLTTQLEYAYNLFMNGQARDSAQVAELCLLLVKSEYLLQKGIYYEYELHDSVNAKDCYKRALVISRNCASLLMEVADAQTEVTDRSEMLQKAFFLSKRLKKIEPQNLVAYYNMANIASREGNMEEALTVINEAIELFPHEPYSHMLKGNIYFNNEEFTEATKEYRKALSIHTSLEIGDQSLTKSSIFDVNACKNNLIGALRRRGRILLVQGTKKSILDEAVSNLEEALHLCPQGVQSANLRFTLRLDLAFCFMKSGNLAQALENLNLIMEDSPVLLLGTYADREESFSNTVDKLENSKPGESGTEASYSYHYLQACQKADSETEPQLIANEHFNAAFLAFNLGLIFSCAKHLKEALKHSDHVTSSAFVTQQ